MFRDLRNQRTLGSHFWQDVAAKAFGYSFFICHASENGPYAKALHDALRAKRIIAFLDEESLHLHSAPLSTMERVVRAMRRSSVFLLIDTPAVRRKPFAQAELREAFHQRRRVVRILQRRGPSDPAADWKWTQLNGDESQAVDDCDRHIEEPASLGNATPNAAIVSQLTALLTWRAWWPWMYRGAAVAALVTAIWVATVWKASCIAASLQPDVVITEEHVRAAGVLFGRYSWLFSLFADGAVSQTRSTLAGLAATVVSQRDVTPTGFDCVDASQRAADDADTMAVLSDMTLRQRLPAADGARVSPGGRYLFAVTPGPPETLKVHELALLRAQDLRSETGEWFNDETLTCTGAFVERDGRLLLLLVQERGFARNELRVFSIPHLVPVGEPLLLPDGAPTAISVLADDRVEVRTQKSVITIRLLPSDWLRWTVPLDRGPVDAGRLGPGEEFALSFRLGGATHFSAKGEPRSLTRDTDKVDVRGFGERGEWSIERGPVTRNIRQPWTFQLDGWSVRTLEITPRRTVVEVQRRSWLSPARTRFSVPGVLLDAQPVDNDQTLRLLTDSFERKVTVQRVPLSAEAFRQVTSEDSR
jgi:hypothetical protein